MLAKSKTAKKELSIVIADLDFFKGINDTYGHDIGDRVIIEFANILTKQQKVDDIACRFGGEEFILLLNCDADNAKIIAQRIRSTAEKCIVKTENNQEVRFTVSIGINQVSQTANNIKESISLADQALYKAKKQGRNCIVVIKE